MAVTTEIQKVAVNVKLNNGTTASGKVKTLTLKLGALNKDTFDASKAYAIADLLAPCLEKAIYSVEKVETSTISSN